MSDNSSDDRFSMPPIAGVWDGAGDEPAVEDESDDTPAPPRGLTLPPPGLFARLQSPADVEAEDDSATSEDDRLIWANSEDDDRPAFRPPAFRLDDDVDEDDDLDASAPDDGQPVRRSFSGMFAPVDDEEDEAAEDPDDDLTDVLDDDADEADDWDDADEWEVVDDPEPPVAPLAGVADAIDAIDVVERLSVEPLGTTSALSGDDLVFADAAEAIGADEADDVAATDEEDVDDVDDVDEDTDDVDDVDEDTDDVDEDEDSDLAAAESAGVTSPITWPESGNADGRYQDEEILPKFLLDDAAPLDIVSAQDELRELAHKNRVRADDERRPTLARTLAEIPVLLIVAAVIAFLVKTFLAQAYYIPSGSMIPQLQIDDRVVVSKLAYKAHDPRRGDIIVFDDPRSGQDNSAGEPDLLRRIGEGVGVVQPSTDEFIKRVIGLPGETVSGHDGYVYINDHKLIEPYLPDGVKTDDFDEQTVAKGRLWVMGDNRSGSADSRVFGQIKIDSIVGRAVVKVWPFSHISFL